MSFPLSKEAILEVAKSYKVFVESNGNVDLYPKELMALESKANYCKYIFGTLLHGLLFFLIAISKQIRLWWLVLFFAKIRIVTDSWSFEPRQCGYNQAYTLVGLYRLRNKNVSGAITALKESWQVYPCPHNTTFGLSRELIVQLSKYPEAKLAIAEYIEIYNSFKA